MAAGPAFEALVEIMRRLRAPDGCPWDREQTLDSLRQWLVEETYEVLDAIERDDPAEHRDELGDLLLQVVFQAQIRAEQGAFDVADVARSITDKMVRRHPHVFGEASSDRAAVRANWHAIKAAEHAEQGKARPSALDGIPRALPALLRALRLGQKAARVGFDWGAADAVFDKLDEEQAELREAVASGEPSAIEAELGDCLFTVVNLARKLGVDPETALHRSCAKFDGRFRALEAGVQAEGSAVGDLDLDTLEAHWARAKSEVG